MNSLHTGLGSPVFWRTNSPHVKLLPSMRLSPLLPASSSFPNPTSIFLSVVFLGPYTSSVEFPSTRNIVQPVLTTCPKGKQQNLLQHSQFIPFGFSPPSKKNPLTSLQVKQHEIKLLQIFKRKTFQTCALMYIDVKKNQFCGSNHREGRQCSVMLFS